MSSGNNPDAKSQRTKDMSEDFISFSNSPDEDRTSYDGGRNNRRGNYSYYRSPQPRRPFRHSNSPRHSTPYHGDRYQNFNRFSPFDRGPRFRNYYRERENTRHFFHPCMLENPWEELEKIYEDRRSNNDQANKKVDGTVSVEDSDSEDFTQDNFK